MRTGNNYSGPRWAFPRRTDDPTPTQTTSGGVSITGGSNRPTEVIRPDAYCRVCGIGPFHSVPGRDNLCGDHADEASRDRQGWTPENSRD